MKRRIGLFIATFLAVGLVACDKQAEESPETAVKPAAPPAIPIAESALITAEVRTIAPQFSHPGTIEALQKAAVRPEISARVIATHFSAGDLVKQGDLLVELDPAEYEAALAAAEAEVAAAKASAHQASTNWKRAQELRPDGYISELDYDTAEAAVESARAQVALKEANLEKARLDIAHTRVYAPFSGRISKPRHAVGDFVQPTGPGRAMFELIQLDPIYAAANIDLGIYNTFAMRRAEMEKRGEEIPELELTLELIGGSTYPHKGTFENWSHQSDENTGMIKGRALFPNPDGLLLPGQNVNLIGRSLQSFDWVMIPQAAVNQDQQGRFVMVLDENGIVQRRDIETGVRDGSDWAIRSGLESGERVIARGGQALRPGTKMTINSGQ